jgi:ornithine cyclodeaminase/alanine dehydrogenase-like protein (mu-crystallin family)
MEPLAGVRITTAESPALAVQGADLIVTATASTTALIDAGDVSEGAHICAVGACRPAHRELGGRLVAQSRLFVDSRGRRDSEAGDIVLAQARDFSDRTNRGELGELLAGRADRAARTTRRPRCSSRSAWPSKTSRPLISRIRGRAIGAAAGRSPCEAAADGGAIIST